MWTIVVLATIVATVVLFYFLLYNRESFTSRQEKANTIYNWWYDESYPTYEKYKSDIDGSDIVEYYGMKHLASNGGLSLDNVMNVIN